MDEANAYDNDEYLLNLAKKGDVGAFEQIVIKYEKLLVNLAYRLLNNREDAEDAACEAFIKAHKNMRRCRGNLKSWICAITRNCCIDIMRKRKNYVYIDSGADDGENGVFLQIPDKEPLPEHKAIQRERREVLEEAIARLKPAFREVVVLIAVNGFSYESAARITGAPEGTVKSRLNRARAALLKTMEQYDSTEGI